jgi:hypothetical protein
VDKSNKILFPCLFEDFKKIVQDEAVVVRLHERSVHLMHQQLGVVTTSETAGQSTEQHKEPNDKAALRDLLIVLAARGDRKESIVFSDEMEFIPPDKVGPHGKLDLLVGTRHCEGILSHAIIVKHADGGETTALQEAILGESKSSLSDLYNTRSVSPDSSSTVQPAVQLLSVSQMKGFREGSQRG